MKTSRDPDDILRDMARIRCDLYEDVEGIVENARVMSDWRHYVKSYPWACLGVAAAVGYLMVPQRVEIVSPDAKTLAKLARKNQLVVTPQAQPQEKKPGLAAAAASMLAGLIMRSAMAWVGQQAGKLMEQGMQRPAEAPPAAAEPAGPPRRF